MPERPRTGPIVVTGARGRLGSALMQTIGLDAVPWTRPRFELDEPDSLPTLFEKDRPRLVLHAAAMTDVDGCARRPDVAMRRNADAVGSLARACLKHGSELMVVSTNEVFDGERDDGRGYGELDEPRPRNAYGASKLAGEELARAEFGSRPGLWVIRAAWLFGPPGNDFPDKIVAAADRLPASEPLPVVADEYASPTLTYDAAQGILAIVADTPGGIFHVGNAGVASRFDWAQRVLAVRRPERELRPIPRTAFERASDPPPWGVLDTSRAADDAGVRLRHWKAALDAYLSSPPSSSGSE